MRSGASGTIGPIERFGARHDVHHRARKQKVELPPLDLAGRVVRAPRLRPRRAVLCQAAATGLEQVCVRRDVHPGGEPGVSCRAVVALEEVLGADLPVGFQLRLGPFEEAELVDVDPRRGDAFGDILEEVCERRRVGVRVDKDERSPRLEPEGEEPEILGLDPALTL